MTDPYLIVDDFLPIDFANELRAAIDAHFGTPDHHRADTHQIWNYWWVGDGQYLYLRTNPAKIFGHALSDRFQAALANWATQTLGMSVVTGAYLSLYVEGCRQGWHNDSGNGRFGYVYSLTKPDRRTTHGETLIWREEAYFANRFQYPGAGPTFYEEIEPRYNRLVVFDDRMPHAVQQIEGSRDPVEGRFALHGHIFEGPPIVEGLPTSSLLAMRELPINVDAYHGPLVLRLSVGSDGWVSGIQELVNRLKPLTGVSVAYEVDRVLSILREIQFSQGPGTLTVPLSFGERRF